jgi:RNA polymerase sigma factor (TIGR02999 family)
VADITLIAAQASRHSVRTAEQLLEQVYDELRQLAAARLARESSAHTLQPTALVHEAWLRLGGESQPTWENARHFFGAAAEAMRRILIDRARRRDAARRGGGRTHLPLDEIEIGGAADDPRLLEVDEALQRLHALDAKKAELVRLRYYAGLSLADAAQVLGISNATAKRWWSYARAWLFRELSAQK